MGTAVTIPTTILPASLGIWSEAVDEVAFAASMSVVPVGMGLNVLFLMMWRFLEVRRGTWSSGTPGAGGGSRLRRSLGGHCEALTVMVLDHIPDHLLAWTGISTTLLAILLGVLGVLRSPPAPKGGSPVTLGTLLARGIAAALAIGASVWIASLGLPIISGMVSVFPASSSPRWSRSGSLGISRPSGCNWTDDARGFLRLDSRIDLHPPLRSPWSCDRDHRCLEHRSVRIQSPCRAMGLASSRRRFSRGDR